MGRAFLTASSLQGGSCSGLGAAAFPRKSCRGAAPLLAALSCLSSRPARGPRVGSLEGSGAGMSGDSEAVREAMRAAGGCVSTSPRASERRFSRSAPSIWLTAGDGHVGGCFWNLEGWTSSCGHLKGTPRFPDVGSQRV